MMEAKYGICYFEKFKPRWCWCSKKLSKNKGFVQFKAIFYLYMFFLKFSLNLLNKEISFIDYWMQNTFNEKHNNLMAYLPLH